MDELSASEKFNLERLVFRRQFLLGLREFRQNQYWTCLPINQGLYLSTHIDLPCHAKMIGDNLVVLVGIAYDPYNPDFDEEEILDDLVSSTENLTSLIKATDRLSGRWVMIYQNEEGTYLFNDPFGFRSIFYYTDGKKHWCASQPELIKSQCEFKYSEDLGLLEYIQSPEFSKKESPMYGSKTIYKDCYHLLPNHYLDFKQMRPVRFYPGNYLAQKPEEFVIEESTVLLRGIFSAITQRRPVALALTSGWDSRLLLAASKEVRGKINYFVDRKGILSEEHPDVWVSKALADHLDLNFEIRSSELEVPGWFTSLLSNNMTGARVLPKTRMIYSKYLNSDCLVYLNGNGGEIFRNYYDKSCRYDPEALDLETIFRLMGFENQHGFIADEISAYLSQFKFPNQSRLNILDYLYWEQRIGNWGAQFPAEQDIAVEEISPLNCRLLINNLLSVPREQRSAPDYSVIRCIIQQLWPEVLDLPINPPSQPQPQQTLRKRLSGFMNFIGNR